jgi:hypothetical protein
MPLYIDLLKGERVDIDNGRVLVEVAEKTGRRVRLSIQASRNIPIRRLCEEKKSQKSRDPPGE